MITRVEWPDASLPLPLIAYTAAPRNSTIYTSVDGGRTYRRRRFARSYDQLQVSWLLTTQQREWFQAFHTVTLYNGTLPFYMDLRYPFNGDLSLWAVRFISEPVINSEDYHVVQATLDLVWNHSAATTQEGIEWTQAPGPPALDGSITTRGYKDTDTGAKWINAHWSNISEPDWQFCQWQLLTGVTWTQGSSNPPIDGSVHTQGYRNLITDVRFLNLNWPSTIDPQWEVV